MVTDVNQYLPEDGFTGKLIGRAWLPNINPSFSGPSPIVIHDGGVYDISEQAATVAQLFNQPENVDALVLNPENRIGNYEDIMRNTVVAKRDATSPYFLSPIDLQAVKACGVTFVCSMLERVIEERAGGDPSKAQAVREKIQASIDVDLNSIQPGSKQAERLKEALQAEGLWSQYLEVGIGPYAEVFTKSQVLSSVGTGDAVGINKISTWNNPEPEVVLIVNNKGRAIGATLGNDVNLRDIEGLSALLLGKAKDNNASCAIGPFIRIFDESFSIDDVRSMEVSLNIEGKDGYELNEVSKMSLISRDVLDLVNQTMNESHQYPDGFALFTGTLFAPTKDRDEKGMGFTHKLGDVVKISAPKLGTLVSPVTYSHEAPAWEFGISTLMENLAKRGLI